MDQHFKIVRAREEIERLNIEIRRMITHMRDEEAFLLHAEKNAAVSNPILAFHIGTYRLDRTRFFHLHRSNFDKVKSLPGFTGTLLPGTSLDPTLTAHLNPILGGDDGMDIDARGQDSSPTEWPREEEGGEEGDVDIEARHQETLDFDVDDDLQTAFAMLEVAEDS